jgi:hypothetical protein
LSKARAGTTNDLHNKAAKAAKIENNQRGALTEGFKFAVRIFVAFAALL